jgi:putative membrane protein
MAVSLLVMVVIDAIVGRSAAVASGGLVALYAVMAVMETLAFAAVFEPPDRLVAVAGGVSMGTFVVLAGRRRWPR